MNYQKSLFFLITIILFCIPFFWLKPGEMDLGGDSSRLYFFDPLAYLHTQVLYGITSSGIGGPSISYYAIPYILLLMLVKFIVNSPTVLIAIFHGLSLSLAFASSYLVVKELLVLSMKGDRKYIEYAALLSGLFYIFSPTLILTWDKVILTHNQIFLNPLMFFLILRFLTRNNIKYLLGALLLSFIFAPNFAFVAAPPFFAFYPLAILFLLLYVKFVLKKPLPVIKIFIGLGLFVLIHFFHLATHVAGIFSGGSAVSGNFSEQAKFSRGLSYFTGVAPSVKVSFSFLSLAQLNELTSVSFGFILFPLIVLLGFLWNKSKLYLLTGIFFLIVFFFVTANITSTGFYLYKRLFDIPGFSMFRNFFGQWVFVFTFFYTLLFGQALFMIFRKIRRIHAIALSAVIVVILVINAIPFLNGSFVNRMHFQSNNVKVPSDIDPEYRGVLEYIHNLNEDSKFISFPLSGPGYQIISGTTGGAYQGPSTISYLTGKNDFTGYDGLVPFNDTFLTLVRNNDTKEITRLFSILNIKYIFYNSDTRIYDTNFPKFPYDYVKDYMPKDQKGYKKFLSTLPIHKVKDFGKNYHLYQVDTYLPHIYATGDAIYASDPLTPYFVLKTAKSLRTVVFTSEVNPQKNAQVIIEAENQNPLLELVNNYHLHKAEPFISTKMSDLSYPFVLWKEKYTLTNRSKISTDYLDYNLLYMAKRIYELEQYKDTPITHKSFVEPKLWEFYQWKNYNSWESNLSRFTDQANRLIMWVNSVDVPDSKRNAMKISINESLNQNDLHIINLIKDSDHSENDKKYLLELKDKSLHQLYLALDLKQIRMTDIPYSVEIPDTILGKYNAYLVDQLGTTLNADQYYLTTNGEQIGSVQNTSPSAVLEFQPFELPITKNNIVLHYTQKNLIDNGTAWIGSGIVEEKSNETVFTFDHQFSEISTFSKKIDDYKQNMQYIVTFEYNTGGDNYLFKLGERQKENGKLKINGYFNKNLASNDWQKSQSIMTALPNSIAGYIQFTTNTSKEKGKLRIRNLTVLAVPSEKLLINKLDIPTEEKKTPTITFQKINPTLYKIHVTNAVDPYFLVFSEAFNANWKLSEDTHPEKDNSIIASYFNGEIKEGNNKNTFFDPIYLQKDADVIADKSHMSGNGYANVWQIQPSDMGGKESYDLVLSYAPQKSVFSGLAISSITAMLVTLYIIFYKKRKK